MGGFAFYASHDDDTPKSLFEISTDPRCDIEVPTFDTFIYIMENFPHIITDITEDYILNQAASSGLSKALLIVQVAWFCTNCASRLFQRLPLSLLEVSTAAHAFCTLLTYFVWLSKPLNVATPTSLREKKAQEVYALLKCSEDEYNKASNMARERATGDPSMPTGPRGSQKIVLAAGALQHLLPTLNRPPLYGGFNNGHRFLIPGAVYDEESTGIVPFLITMAVSPVFYGLVHLLAWSDQFPTPLERQLWHVSTVVVTCSGLVEVFFIRLSRSRSSERYKTFGNIVVVLIFVVPLAHVLASGFLIIESVRQLLFLDDAAYELPAWSNYWPHFS